MPRSSRMILGFAALCLFWPVAGPGRAEDTGATAAAPAASGHEAAGHGAAAHQDPYDLSHQNATPVLEDPTEFRSDLALWTLVVFLLLLGLLLKFAWRPIIDGLEKREHAIAAMINEAKQSAEKAAAQLAQYEARLAAASAEAQQLITRAQKDAEATKDQIVAEARAAAKKERDRAVADIENAKNSALQEMTRKSVDLATVMASRIVRRQLQPEDQAQLIREALDQLPSRN